jgi:ABC-type branched-subunit amino acid transport system ATPase component
MPLALETRNLVKRFGGFIATNDVNLSVEVGERHALIGPNGAGKTTLINLLTGFLEPSAGRVVVNGEDVTGLTQHRRVARGVARTFQVNQMLLGMTPLEAVVLAVVQRRGKGGAWWRRLGSHTAAVEEAAELLDSLGLLDVAHETTSQLAYGKQRLLEIALALALKPRVLLLDEPAAGVPEAEGEELFATIAALPRDVTVLLIEHDMNLVFKFAERITVLVGGAICVQGTPEAIAADPKVREVYLGEEADHG